MYLSKIGAKNFLGYKSLSLTVEPGLTLIDGRNHHFSSSSSGGAGKSSLEEVIAVGSFGKTIRDMPRGKVIHDGTSYAKVWNDYVQNDGKVFRVIHYRNHPKYKNDARLLIDGDDKTTGRYSKDSNHRIVEKLGFDFDIFKRSIVIHSRMTDSFIDVKDSYLKRITEKLIGIPDFDPLLKRVKLGVDKISYSIDSMMDRIELTRQLVSEKRDAIKKYRDKYDEFEERRNKRKLVLSRDVAEYKRGLKVSKRKSKKYARLFNRCFARVEALKVELETVQSAVSACGKISLKFLDEIAAKKARIDVLNEFASKYRRLGGSTCPECGQNVSKAHVKDKIFANAKEYSDLTIWLSKSKVIESRNFKSDTKLCGKRDQLRKELDGCVDKVANYRAKRDRYDIFVDEFNKSLKKLKNYSEEKNPYGSLIKGAKKYVLEHERRIEVLKSKVSRRRKKLLYYEFWKRGFGPSGIRSYVLDSIRPVLNRIANIYLDVLMDGNMSVSLNTVKQKEDGTYSDRFEIEIENQSGSNILGGSCDNELHSVDFALNLAMSDILESRIAGGFGFLLLDQVLDLFDTVRGGKAIQLLKCKLNEEWCRANKVPYKRSIWVITHREQLKGLFDNVIMVSKRDGVCRIMEQT